MFDPLLNLRRRQLTGVPQVQGNILPPDVGPDISAPMPVVPPMQMPAPMPMAEPDFTTLGQLGGKRGMDFLVRKLKPAGKDALALSAGGKTL